MARGLEAGHQVDLDLSIGVGQGVNGGARSAGSGGDRHRLASVLLGAGTALVAVLALITATSGSGSIGQTSDPAPASPSAVVSFTAAEVALGPGAAPIYPLVPVKVTVRQGTLRTVRVIDTKTGQQVPGTLAPDALSWQSSAPLAYSDTYQVAADALGADHQIVHRSTSVATVHPATLTSASLSPGLDTVGVGQPLVVRFNHPVSDKTTAEKALSVTTNPQQSGAWYWISASEAHYRAEAYWQPGTTIQLAANLFGMDLGNGAFGEANRAITVHVHDSWVAKADGRSEVMQIFHNGAMVKSMPISLGSPAHPSHVGPHVISARQPSIVMDSCTYGVCKGDPGYYKEKVDLDERISNDGEFVHSAPWSVGQQGDSNVSHGCVNLSPADARWFFDTFGIGDVVEITNSGGPKLPIYDTYGDWEIPWNQWHSGSAT
ncbi:MAG TPA: Ig-like domain-containing protein [Pseudonocardiaceae bacterium]